MAAPPYFKRRKTMRFYLVKIAYNKVAKAEDRPAPQGFDTFDEAKKAFHSFMYQSILGETIGWAMALIINEVGNTEYMDRWVSPVEEEVEEG